MEVRETGPTDDEFSKLLDERAPNRLNDPTPEALENIPPPDDDPVLGDEPELEVTPPAVAVTPPRRPRQVRGQDGRRTHRNAPEP